jgi:hypothetical protein
MIVVLGVGRQSARGRREMNFEAARTYAKRIIPETPDTRVTVAVPVNTGTHHTIVVFGRTPNGGSTRRVGARVARLRFGI